jgi:hypothetical protein
MKKETGLRYSGNREIKNVWKETVEDAMWDFEATDYCRQLRQTFTAEISL